MSFLTKPTVTKGEPSSFTLVKSELVSLVSKVALDDFFSNTANWKRVTIQFKNLEGQEEVLVFDAAEGTPTASFDVTEKARADYQVTRIIIKDLDDGTLVIKRSELSPSLLTELDVSFQAILMLGLEYLHTTDKATFDGWSVPETYQNLNFRWSSGFSSKIIFNTAFNEINTGEMSEIVLRFFTLGSQQITLSLNGNVIYSKQHSVSHENPLTLTIPFQSSYLINGVNTLDFNLPGASKPVNDQRFIALALMSFQINILSGFLVYDLWDLDAKHPTSVVNEDTITITPSLTPFPRSLAYSVPIQQIGKQYIEFTQSLYINLGISGFLNDPQIFGTSASTRDMFSYFYEEGSSVFSTFFSADSNFFGIAVNWEEGSYSGWSYDHINERLGIGIDFDTRQISFYRNGQILTRPTGGTHFSFPAGSTQIRVGIHAHSAEYGESSKSSTWHKTALYTPVGYSSLLLLE